VWEGGGARGRGGVVVGVEMPEGGAMAEEGHAHCGRRQRRAGPQAASRSITLYHFARPGPARETESLDDVRELQAQRADHPYQLSVAKVGLGADPAPPFTLLVGPAREVRQGPQRGGELEPRELVDWPEPASMLVDAIDEIRVGRQGDRPVVSPATDALRDVTPMQPRGGRHQHRPFEDPVRAE